MLRGRIVLAGGSGFLGRALAEDLTRDGYQVVVLTRRPRANARVRQVAWDGRTLGEWAREVDDGLRALKLARPCADRARANALRRQREIGRETQ